MITGQLRSRIDKLWEEFWTGGITNPLTVIEQISFLMFSRLLDMRESTEEKRWNRTNKGKPFPGSFFTPGEEGQKLRWSNFRHLGEAVLPLVRDKVFPHFRTLGTNGHQSKDEPKNTFAEYMKDAQLMIQKPSLLVSAVNMIEELPLGQGDTKGDLYEYLLGKLTTAGINGQFRTPRHIISLMVDLMEPEPTWVIGDPACGTGGFLVSVMEHLRKKYTSKEGRIVEKVAGEEVITYTGDLLEPYRRHIQSGMFHGFDFDVTMLRIAAMNLMLHGVDTPDIHYQDTLSNNFPERFPRYAKDCFDLILANPPFKGSLDEQDVHPSLIAKVKTRKTELLFLTLMLRMLKTGGRCAVIVPDGVLFGSSGGHVAARRLLVEDNQLEAVVKLPAGVFKPYAGVSTAILIFTKGGQTTDVWFYEVQADGLSLDDKRDPVVENDLPDVRARWAKRNPKKDTDRKGKAFFVPKAEIVENKYDLSLNRYKEVVHEAVKYDPPNVILARLKRLLDEISRDLAELEGGDATMKSKGKISFPQVPISAFCETGSGGTPARSKASVYYGGPIPWVKSGELREKTITKTEETLTELGLKESAAKLLPRDTLLVALYGATVGRIGVLGIEAATNQAVCHIIPDDTKADRRYLFYALQSQVPLWLSKRVGVGQPNISQGIIRDTLIPLPLLSEQKRIAKTLDLSFGMLQKHLAATAVAKEALDSLVQRALRGEL